MAGPFAISTTGGTADVISYPLEDTHPIANINDVDEALAFAAEALNAAECLEQAEIDPDVSNSLANKLLNVAVENYIERFHIPRAALEANELTLSGSHSSRDSSFSASGVHGASADDATAKRTATTTEDNEKLETGKLKKVILYLYALVQRIFKAIFDFFGNQKLVARKLIPLTKQYIGEADSLSDELAAKLSIKDRSVMRALQIDGVAPEKVTELYSKLAVSFERQHAFSAVAEVVRLISATKEQNPERISKEATALRDKLESGLKASLPSVNPQTMSIFSEKKSDAANYYASEPLFGHNHIYGIVGTDVSNSGTFRFQCGVRADEDIELRVDSFPVLTPEQIRAVCRIALKVCENIVKFSRDEELMRKALREATFLTTKEADKSTVVALRNIMAVGQNSYITHLRFTARTTQALMRWCAASVRAYHNVESAHE